MSATKVNPDLVMASLIEAGEDPTWSRINEVTEKGNNYVLPALGDAAELAKRVVHAVRLEESLGRMLGVLRASSTWSIDTAAIAQEDRRPLELLQAVISRMCVERVLSVSEGETEHALIGCVGQNLVMGIATHARNAGLKITDIYQHSDLAALFPKLVNMAQDHIDDSESGLEDGTYAHEENRDLAGKREALEDFRKFYVEGTGDRRPSFVYIQSVLEMVDTQIEDIESGLEDGTYEAADNADLPEKREARDLARSMFLPALRTQADALARFPKDLAAALFVEMNDQLPPKDVVDPTHDRSLYEVRDASSGWYWLSGKGHNLLLDHVRQDPGSVYEFYRASDRRHDSLHMRASCMYSWKLLAEEAGVEYAPGRSKNAPNHYGFLWQPGDEANKAMAEWQPDEAGDLPPRFEQQVADLREHIDSLGESYADMLTQYKSETALYGDAGPGQGVALQDASANLSRLKAELAKLLDTPAGKVLVAREEEAERAWVESLESLL